MDLVGSDEASASVSASASASASADELFSQLRSAMGTGDRDRPSSGRRFGALAGAVAAVAAVAVGLSWLRPVASPSAGAGSAAAGAVVHRVPTSTVPPLPSTSTSTPARVWPADDPPVVDGTEVRRGEERWAIGEPGDLVAVGDWDCDGAVTPAVLRPSAAQVFVFSTWADDASAVAGPDAPADAVSFVAKGCGRGEVTTAAGAVVEIETVEEGR